MIDSPSRMGLFTFGAFEDCGEESWKIPGDVASETIQHQVVGTKHKAYDVDQPRAYAIAGIKRAVRCVHSTAVVVGVRSSGPPRCLDA